jgi:hypothetical protein
LAKAGIYYVTAPLLSASSQANDKKRLGSDEVCNHDASMIFTVVFHFRTTTKGRGDDDGAVDHSHCRNNDIPGGSFRSEFKDRLGMA